MDTPENRLMFRENAIDQIATELSHVIRKLDAIHRVGYISCVVVDLSWSAFNLTSVDS